jgi:HD-GYP domain-containing protein (c-di-GMP phosphodiesterase class II)
MPLAIIQKPGKLSDEEYKIVKKHTELGFHILTENKMNYHVRCAALQHHERCDGTGYPQGLTARHIDQYAKIVSIVDVYDAMTSPRVYRGPMCPFDVIDVFLQEGLQKYESEYILTFLRRIAESYINEKVRISDGREGRIVYISNFALSRPTVLVDGEPIDLYKEKSLRIQEIL